MLWRGAAAKIFGPFAPPRLWQWANEVFAGPTRDILKYTAIRSEHVRDLAGRAAERDLDFTYRPWKDGIAMRLWVLSRGDHGNYHKGSLAGWGVDQRDPTSDRRLVEYCLSIPTEHILRTACRARSPSTRLPIGCRPQC